MNTIEINTKFDIGDLVYGFTNGEVHKLIIDRIDITLARYNKDNPFNNFNIIYLATTIDESCNHQYRFSEKGLFTKDEIINLVNEYFKNNKL